MAEDTLVVVSKLKAYIKAQAGMNTSGNVAPKISAIIRTMCDRAVESARADGRKTVMDRDFD
jgi:histone H3/H4